MTLKHYLKDDVRDLIDRWITVIRNDQAFHNSGYRVVSVIHLDNAGEWQLGCAARVVHSWEGLLNNQTGCFGRGLSPPLEWKLGRITY